VSIEREVFPAMVADGVLYALRSDAAWIDAGTPGSYLEVQLQLAERTGWVPRGVDVHTSATIEASVLRCGATIGPRAHVRRAVVGHDTVVEADASVCRSILGDGVRIGAGAVLDGLCIIGDGESVPPGARLHSAVLPLPG
jgi:mannose-1-phosphate guanylyltransferase